MIFLAGAVFAGTLGGVRSCGTLGVTGAGSLVVRCNNVAISFIALCVESPSFRKDKAGVGLLSIDKISVSAWRR